MQRYMATNKTAATMGLGELAQPHELLVLRMEAIHASCCII